MYRETSGAKPSRHACQAEPSSKSTHRKLEPGAKAIDMSRKQMNTQMRGSGREHDGDEEGGLHGRKNFLLENWVGDGEHPVCEDAEDKRLWKWEAAMGNGVRNKAQWREQNRL